MKICSMAEQQSSEKIPTAFSLERNFASLQSYVVRLTVLSIPDILFSTHNAQSLKKLNQSTMQINFNHGLLSMQLHSAAASGKLDIVKHLLSADRNKVNSRDGKQVSSSSSICL